MSRLTFWQLLWPTPCTSCPSSEHTQTYTCIREQANTDWSSAWMVNIYSDVMPHLQFLNLRLGGLFGFSDGAAPVALSKHILVTDWHNTLSYCSTSNNCHHCNTCYFNAVCSLNSQKCPSPHLVILSLWQNLRSHIYQLWVHLNKFDALWLQALLKQPTSTGRPYFSDRMR